MSDLLQNHMSTSHTIRTHAKEVWDKSDKGGCQSRRKVVPHNSKSDLPLNFKLSLILFDKGYAPFTQSLKFFWIKSGK